MKLKLKLGPVGHSIGIIIPKKVLESEGMKRDDWLIVDFKKA